MADEGYAPLNPVGDDDSGAILPLQLLTGLTALQER
jgi:hypothetical protein